MRYPCLVLDHDETVVQTEKTMGYPFFCEILQTFRPGAFVSLEDYVADCHTIGFVDMCRNRFGFTDEELQTEHLAWLEYVRCHVPDIFPGIDDVIRRQKAEGGLLCVVSHSNEENILRDYLAHFGITPDAIYGFDLPPNKRKPNSYPLTDIMGRYQLSPKELLVVDDSKLGFDMANPLGVDVAFSAWGKENFPQLSEEMEKLCRYTFPSTKDLEKFLFD